jgi:hypothetical protein
MSLSYVTTATVIIIIIIIIYITTRQVMTTWIGIYTIKIIAYISIRIHWTTILISTICICTFFLAT